MTTILHYTTFVVAFEVHIFLYLIHVFNEDFYIEIVLLYYKSNITAVITISRRPAIKKI